MSIDHWPNRRHGCLRRDDTVGSRDIVFLPRHELRNKITTRNWNYPRITIAPGVIAGLSVYRCVRKRKQCSTNGLAARTGFRRLPRSSTARASAKRFVFNTPQRPCSRLAAERSEQENMSRIPQCNFGQRMKREATRRNTRSRRRSRFARVNLIEVLRVVGTCSNGLFPE